MRIFKSPPHLLARVAVVGSGGGVGSVGVFAQLVVQQAFGILPLAVAIILVATVADDVRNDAEEGQLFVVAGQTFVLGVVQLAGAVVVEDVAEDVGIPVEKVLFGLLVVKELALVGAQQSVGIFLQRIPPRFEAATCKPIRTRRQKSKLVHTVKGRSIRAIRPSVRRLVT